MAIEKHMEREPQRNQRRAIWCLIEGKEYPRHIIRKKKLLLILYVHRQWEQKKPI